MKNPKNVDIIEGRWYLVLRGPNIPRIEVAMKYTTDPEDAYHVSHLFCKTCNVEIVCMLQEV